MRKCILLCTVALLALLVLLCGTASAAIVESGYCGDTYPVGNVENVRWTLDSAGTLRITGTGETNWNDSNRFEDPLAIKNVVIGEGITNAQGLWGCENLVSVSLPESVTRIYGSCFAGCTSLSSIKLPSGLKRIWSGAFSGCTSLSSINLPEGLEEIDNYTFRNCTSLRSIDLPESLTTLGRWAFMDCHNLRSVHIGGNLTKIGESVFCHCHNLSEVTLSEGLKTIGVDMFSDNPSLQYIDIPSTVETIGASAFEDTGLKTIHLPEGVKFFGEFTFQGFLACFHTCDMPAYD